jgi:hypothetical protein
MSDDDHQAVRRPVLREVLGLGVTRRKAAHTLTTHPVFLPADGDGAL